MGGNHASYRCPMSESAFGRYIRAKRVEAGLSLRDVARSLGVSHVFLGEVERGARPLFPKERWPDLLKAIPGLTMEGLEEAAVNTRPVQLRLQDAPQQYQSLGLLLARRIEQRDLTPKQIEQIRSILSGGQHE
jgi:transcriptional regulator with XRE-family HTH domain